MREPRLDGGLGSGWSTAVVLGVARWCGWFAVVVGALAVFLLGQWVARYSAAYTAKELEEPQTAAGFDAVYHQLASAHSTLVQAVFALLTVGAALGVRSLLRRSAHAPAR